MNTTELKAPVLQQAVSENITQYLSSMESSNINNLYDLLLEQIEPPLLKATMEHSKFNQVRAAKTLGLSRGTLRKKLIQYFDDKYCGKIEKSEG